MPQVTDEHQLQTALQTLLSQNNDRLILLGVIGFIVFLIVLVLVFRTVASNQGKQLDLMRDLNKSNDKRNDEFNIKMDRLNTAVEGALNASATASQAQLTAADTQTRKLEELSARMAYLAENQNRFYKEQQKRADTGSDKLVKVIEAQTKEIQVANTHTVNYHNLVDDNLVGIKTDIENLKAAIDELVTKDNNREERVNRIFQTLDKIWDEVKKKGTGEIVTNGIQ